MTELPFTTRWPALSIRPDDQREIGQISASCTGFDKAIMRRQKWVAIVALQRCRRRRKIKAML